MRTKRYIPDLNELHALAERNYAAFLRVLPSTQEPTVIAVGTHLNYEIQVLRRAPYTTDVYIKQLKRSTSRAAAVADIEFHVRLYHDARMAEIIDCQGTSQLTSIRPGQAPKRAQQQDEKRQLSRLLADWLKLCIQHGRSAFCWAPA